jgi:phthalate 4,5-cis-dihydrodiol dehydrogenase
VDPLRIGVIGLGRAFMLTRPTLIADPRCRLVAAADPRPEARAAFEAEFGGRGFDNAQALCEAPDVEAVYVATSDQLHAGHAVGAIAQGKAVLVEKPLAPDLSGCRAIRDAADASGVPVVVGPSHGFDRPITRASELIASGDFGALRMVTALNYTDYVYRPRRPEELRAEGGGVVLGQAVHHVDVVRTLAGSPVSSVRATAGAWDDARPMLGAYQALLSFTSGASAVIGYSGYGRYDTDELMDWRGETGGPRDPGDYGAARRRLGRESETALKNGRLYGGAPASRESPQGHEHFGFVLASCERADLRPTADGVEIYGESERRFIELPPPATARSAVIDELWAAVREGVAPRHDAAWGEATAAVCLAMLKSSAEGREVTLREMEAA